jgi:SAM-dependent methyltransferase
VITPGDGANDAAALQRLIMGFRASQLVHVAARLGLADLLAQGPLPADRLAQAAGVEPQALQRVLRALASLGLFAETTDGNFTLTPMARLLQSTAAGSLRGLALLYGEEWLWQVYGRMLDSVRTGRPAFQQVHGQGFYEYLEAHPCAARLFQAGMSGYSAQEAPAILGAYDLRSARRIVDVGGGEGRLAAALLRAIPDASATILDLESAREGAQRTFAQAGVPERAAFVAGDFFAGVPAGGDVYLLKNVLHNWQDAEAVRILRNCRAAMSETARLLVIERVVPPGNTPSEAKLFDVNMLVVIGGRERTEREHRALFAAVGLTLTRVVATAAPISLVEGALAQVPSLRPVT